MQMSWFHLLQEAPTWRNLAFISFHASFHHYEAITLACKNLSPLPFASLLLTTNPTEWIPVWLWMLSGEKHELFMQVNRGGLMRTRCQLMLPIFPLMWLAHLHHALALQVDSICLLRSFVLTVRRTSTWPDQHISISVKLLFDFEALLIQGYNLHSTDMSGTILGWGLLDQCASPESCWLFCTYNNTRTVILLQGGFIHISFLPNASKKKKKAKCFEDMKRTRGATHFLFFAASFIFLNWKML